MNSHAKPVPASISRLSLRRGKEKAFAVAYSIVVIVAMIGWLIGFGWVTIQVAKWLLI